MKRKYQDQTEDNQRQIATTSAVTPLPFSAQDAPVGRKPRAAVYGRRSPKSEGKSKSVKEQVDEGLLVCDLFGLQTDEKRIYKELAGRKGDWWWEGSGMPGAHREALGRLVADIEAGLIDVVVVWRTDRLYRDAGVADALLKILRKYKVRLIASRHDYAIHTAAGFANASQEAVRNREMRDKASEDIKRDLDFKARTGQLVRSPACLGFRSAGTDTQAAVAIPNELDLVRRIFRMFVYGEETEAERLAPMCLNQIAAQLLSEGVRLPRLREPDKGEYKATINGNDIRRILEHVAYVAKQVHDGKVYDCPAFLVPAADGSGKMETVVPPTLWRAAQEKLALETKWDKRKDGLGDPHLLTGLVLCGGCGRPAYVQTRGTGENARGNFHCIHIHGDRKCKRGQMRHVNEKMLERWMLDELTPVLAEALEEIRSAAGRDADRQKLTALKRQVEEALTGERTILRRSAHLDDAQFAALASDLRAEREALQRQIDLIADRLVATEESFTSFSVEEMAQMPRSALRTAYQRAIAWIAICWEGVIVHPRWGGYIAATFRRGDPARGEHRNLKCLAVPSVADTLECMTWISAPVEFVLGRRETLKGSADGLADGELLPGHPAFMHGAHSIGEGAGDDGYIPEFDLPSAHHRPDEDLE